MAPTNSSSVTGLICLTFADLPREFRDLIWSFALPSYCVAPQVHFFGLKRNDADEKLTIRWGNNSRVAQMNPSYILCPPDGDEDGLRTIDEHDWANEENHSAYLATGSFWHACSESREILHRQCKHHYKKQMREGRIRGAEDAQVVTFFSAKDLARHCITMRPGIDLMHISTNSLHEVEASDYPFQEYFNPVSFAGTANGPEINVQHFGVDYDRNWTEQLAHLQEELEESTYNGGGFQSRWDPFSDKATALHGVIAIAGGFWAMCRNAKKTATLWLVDYDLQLIFSGEGHEEMANTLARSTPR